MSHPSIRLKRKILRHIDLEGVVGVILFGSTARSEADRFSDIDIAIFWNRNLNHYERLNIEGVEVELLWYPIRQLAETFDEGVRDRRDTWMKTCFWLNLLRGGVIIHDRDGTLADYRERAIDWRWRGRELESTLEVLRMNRRMAERLLEEGRDIEATLCLRDALNLMIVHHLMSRGEIPSYRPKEINRAAAQLGYPTLYRELMGLIERPKVNEVLNICSRIHSRFRGWSPTVERSFRETLKSAARGDMGLTLLSARHYALRALREALMRRGMEAKLEYFNSESHIRLLERAEGVEDEILNGYLRLQSLGGLPDAEELRNSISIISGSYL
ncbi:MAG TPA: nucleotidyltransferase domain-containing protein [Candidatus Bathyarchaeota archaeon]|nr:nucleotidyltransferase domain-containing protein [Candidatus Bathyarchaeota archaeon]